MSDGLTLTFTVHRARNRKGGVVLREGVAPVPEARPGRVPRVARLAALAVRFEGLVRSGAVRDYAELARLGHVTRARVTQIMNLAVLAPDVLEEILHLPLVTRGRDPLNERDLRSLSTTLNWAVQRTRWRALVDQTGAETTFHVP
ncbi:MAG: hypothetical protein IT436_13575 [Phycisphaerales bacterium]|nr:hypothetical protein [Phycisphaerales bacterium]